MNSNRVFLILSIALFIVVVVLMNQNIESLERQFSSTMHEYAVQTRSSFDLALEMEYENLLRTGNLVTSDPGTRELFLAGRNAVLRNTGDQTNPDVDRVRGRLRDHLLRTWGDFSREFGLRRVEFHISPGPINFLQIYNGDSPDRLEKETRRIVSDVMDSAKTRMGFEDSGIHSGLRIAIPLFDGSPLASNNREVGVLVVGTSFDRIFETIDRRLNGGVAALLKNESDSDQELSRSISSRNVTVLSSSRSQVEELIRLQKLFPRFQGESLLMTFVSLKTGKVLVTHIPLYDYAGDNQIRRQVGRVLFWRNITAEEKILTTSIVKLFYFAFFGYLALEILLYYTVTRITLLLQKEIDTRTTEIRNNRDEMILLKEKAESSNRAKSAFLATVSHELRTPLNSILGFAQLLEEDKTLSSKNKNEVRQIKRSGNALLTVINSILDLARMEAGKVELAKGPVFLNIILQDIHHLLREQAGRKGIALIVEPANLPASVMGDEQRIKQILLNLIGNSIKFTETGYIRLSVTNHEVKGDDGQEYANLDFVVQDTGTGIQESFVSSVFDTFSQGGDTLTKSDGIGLGLGITRELVRMMGGKLHMVTRVKGKPIVCSDDTESPFMPAVHGTVFWFSLQLPVHEKQAKEAPVEEPTSGIALDVSVLVVDDDETNRSFLSRLLQRKGFTVYEASDGKLAYSIMKEKKPPILITDLYMPEMNGLELVEQLRMDPLLKKTKIILLSGESTEDARKHMMESGIDLLFEKPVQSESLIQALIQLYQEPEQDDEKILAPSQKEHNLPDISVLQQLNRLNDSGQMDRVLRIVRNMEKDFPEFVRNVVDYIDQFRLHELRDFLEQSILLRQRSEK